MLRNLAITIIACSSALFAGESRTWKSADGTNSFTAEFISRKADTVTLRRSNGSIISFDMSKLHADDQAWLKTKEQPGQGKTKEVVPDANAVFDTLFFGDSRAEVTEKMKKSKIVSSDVASTFFARTGLNGVFHTKHKIGGLYCYLFFDWDENDKLKEITLQTESKDLAEYKTTIESCWKELTELISPIHGKPLQHMPIPNPSTLQDEAMMGTHLWRMDQGGTVILGTSRIGNGYQVIVRFTKEKIEPVIVP